MAVEDVGIRLSLQGRREAAAGLSETKKEIQGVGDAAEETGKKASRGFLGLKKFGGFLGGVVKGGVIGVATAGIATLGVALHKGFERLVAIDDAKAKLEGLGITASKAAKIINGPVLAAVHGTAFGLDEAASSAAGAMASGIRGSRPLTKYLSLVGDAATQAGVSFNDMGQMMNKVQGQGKLTGDVVQQMAQNGLYVMPMLAKAYGKPQAAMQKMVSAGAVSATRFRKILEQNIGGAALKSGKTFTGAWKNMQASLGRTGAGLEGGLFPHLAPALTNLTKAMKPLETHAAILGDKVGKILGPALENAVPWVSRMVDKISHLNLGDAAKSASGLGGSFKKIGNALSGVDWSQVGQSFGKGTSDSLSVFAVVVGFLAGHLKTLAKLMPEILAAFAMWKAAQAAQNVLGLASIPIRTLQAASNIALARAMKANTEALRINNGVQEESTAVAARGRIAMVASKVAALAMRGATLAWAGAQRVLNLVMSNNPLGWAIKITMLLVGAFILAYKKSETFRNIVNGALHGVADAAKWMWNSVLQPVLHGFVDGLGHVMVAIGRVLQGMGHFVPGAGAAGNAMVNAGHAAEGLAGRLQKIGDSARQSAGPVVALATALNALHGGNATIRTVHQAGALSKITGIAGARAMGGPVFAGRTYWVGERGPELFQPSLSGFIHPHQPNLTPSTPPRAPKFDLGEDAGAGRGTPIVLQNVMDGNVVGERVVGYLQGRIARA